MRTDIRRLADAAERIANALEKIAGVSEAVPEKPSQRPRPKPGGPLIAAPRPGQGRFHAIRVFDDGFVDPWGWCQSSNVRLDMDRAVLASELSDGERCRHPACYQQLSGSPYHPRRSA